MRHGVLSVMAVLGALPIFATPAGSLPEKLPKLPEGDAGIAVHYPGDKGIEADPAVVFADDFESHSTAADLRRRWNVLVHEGNLSISDQTDHGLGGTKSLLLTIPQQSTPLATGVDRVLTDTQDVLFLRWYQKFDRGWMVPGGSVHNGSSISAKYVDDQGRATPGIRADGHNKFLVNFESENATGESPGLLNAYVYWPEQGDRWGDHFYPSGTVIPFSVARSGVRTFGGHFEARRDFSPQLGRWYCYEFMVKANTPGQRDARIAMWVDGALIADFPNLRLRDIQELKIDRFGLGLYIASNTKRENRVWLDNVVTATSYIGPVVPRK